ncbi:MULTISPECIES: Mini-ribonuclease 3 [Aerococcus]|uniref:Mini-ribonuclease 3 n=1 Tax=Aerococcus sanguinicola TaxID=119206 RepID=A0A5N1GLR0_9LACT|nr:MULTISPECIES: ribonuclease III domain-containing protein [Aerococcus]KAA9299650.1 ribonuclease III [Aerococcus sanguinicola]MDK6369961.1 ribonuclease III domain-containing protein [Aerococcus sp. UMB9870]MDK6680565.1 ribonuclease III domain-containing protein [Aerococcus sp. UMB8608]MDK6687395.1 ribonuclease III domain-containing protein [Aerococcus sp. UMB8623]MDK6940484.1 ribonuclease III domain-containing protein [Aerococcus sp. UMB8487]
MKDQAIKQLSGLPLAYMGDAAWEICVRQMLLETGLTRPKDLHQAATHYVSARGQALAMEVLLADDRLSEEEVSIYKRGRNASPHTSAKNASKQDYRVATGFEALMGYLYLSQSQGRFEDLSQQCLAIIEERIDHESK